MAQKKPIAAAIFSMVISRRSAAARAVCRGVLGVNYYCRDAGEREGQPGEQEKLFFMMSPLVLDAQQPGRCLPARLILEIEAKSRRKSTTASYDEIGPATGSGANSGGAIAPSL
jgi:hypothetical protein